MIGGSLAMKTHWEKYRQQKRFSAFWERMALRYPLPFEDKTPADTHRVLSLVKSKGVKFLKASVLDIGCGTGIYSLPLAYEVDMVTGLDDSETMIARMTDIMQSEDIQNVQPVKAAWKDIDISASGFEKAFDIVWISMSPAVQTVQDFERMEKCARKWCVYIGWGRKRKNALMEEVFSLHGIHYGPPSGVGAAYDILVHSGRTPSLDYFETSWEWTGPAEDALEDIVCFIEMQGGRARRDLIKKTLECHERDGLIHHTTDVEEGVMVWPVE
jgi:SAM-dependent methyltransferase